MNKCTQALLLCSLLIMFLPSAVNAQNYVKSLTRPAEVTASNGEKYSAIRVVCVGSKGTRYIFRKEGGNRWCVTPNGGECKGKKFAVAKRACILDADSGVTQSLANFSTQGAANAEAVEGDASPAAPTATKVVASNNQALETEKRSIEIEREKIKLRREELELRKTQLEAQIY